MFDIGSHPAAPIIRFSKGSDAIFSANQEGFLDWDLKTGDTEVLFEGNVWRFVIDRANRHVVFIEILKEGLPPSGRAMWLDLASGLVTPLVSHGDGVTAIAMDAAGTVVVSGDEPVYLFRKLDGDGILYVRSYKGNH